MCSESSTLSNAAGGSNRASSRAGVEGEATADADSVWSTATGPPGGGRIVLVHGTLDRAAGLVKLARRLSDRFRVERFDRRGYGRSRRLAGPYDIETNVDDLRSVIERSDAPVTLFGHSYGGNVCLAAAQRFPDRVRAVAVYEAPMPWLRDGPAASPDDVTMWRDDPAGAAEGFMRRLVGDAVWEHLPASTRRERRAEGIAMVEELADLGERAPWQAPAIEVPVLAMYGERGRTHHREAMRLLAATARRASEVEVPDANHFGPHRRPGVVAEHLANLALSH